MIITKKRLEAEAWRVDHKIDNLYTFVRNNGLLCRRCGCTFRTDADLILRADGGLHIATDRPDWCPRCCREAES
jgi:hypothetical protein